MLHYGFGIMRLNRQYILSIASLLLSSKINLLLNVCFIVLLIMIFYVLLGVFVFLFYIHIMLISWIFFSSQCVFLGYSSFHLSYRCLNFASQRVYISRYIRFHEDVFSFAKSKQIAQHPQHLLLSYTAYTLANPNNFPKFLPHCPVGPPNH